VSKDRYRRKDMITDSSTHPRIPEVLEAFKLLLNDSMALDYCGITGKERKLILNDPVFARESRKLKAEKYIEEIKDINGLIKSLGNNHNENARFSEGDEDPTKIINLKMKVAAMRREMLSLTSSSNEAEESESLNIFFIDITKEDFERMLNVEIHEGEENTRLLSEEGKEAPMDKAIKAKDEGKKKNSIPAELLRNTIEYTDAHGDKIIEEVTPV
jgi:hypothetical protein